MRLFSVPALRFAAVLSFGLLAGCVEDGEAVTRASFEARGLDWPLTVDAGQLGCKGRNGFGAVWFKTKDGKAYAVNGIAQKDFAKLEPIWAVDEDSLRIIKLAGGKVDYLPRVSSGDLISEGLKLCR
ncbi:hypothetical protein CDV53_14005 [Haematobacter missouriensis]|nr:hypothetical protein CDV53_14005 [Haematobacter missouriensis]